MKWSKEELEHLIYLAESDWTWEFPGWGWIASKLNAEFKNNRSKRACSQKFSKWVISQQFNEIDSEVRRLEIHHEMNERMGD